MSADSAMPAKIACQVHSVMCTSIFRQLSAPDGQASSSKLLPNLLLRQDLARQLHTIACSPTLAANAWFCKVDIKGFFWALPRTVMQRSLLTDAMPARQVRGAS